MSETIKAHTHRHRTTTDDKNEKKNNKTILFIGSNLIITNYKMINNVNLIKIKQYEKMKLLYGSRCNTYDDDDDCDDDSDDYDDYADDDDDDNDEKDS